MIYNVKLPKFEGPLELLLELIEKEKMAINELSLAKVADQYLEFLRNSENIHLENLVDFLSVASRLILIKSRTLLPTLTVSDQEEEEIKDLEQQLREYKKFKEVSSKIGRMVRLHRHMFSKEGFKGVKSVFYPPENINKYDLKKQFAGVLSQIPVLEKLSEEMVEDVITLEEKIQDLAVTIRKRVEISFSELVSQSSDKIEVIVSFLAMLEMVKQRIVDVEQGALFEEIKLSMKA